MEGSVGRFGRREAEVKAGLAAVTVGKVPSMREKQWQPGFELLEFRYPIKSRVMTAFWPDRDYWPISSFYLRIVQSPAALER